METKTETTVKEKDNERAIQAERIVNNMPLVNGSGRVARLFPQS